MGSVTPLEKLLCLKKVHDQINRAVEKNLTSRYLDIGAHQMTTDDLLDQLIYGKSKVHTFQSVCALNRAERIGQKRQKIEHKERSSGYDTHTSHGIRCHYPSSLCPLLLLCLPAAIVKARELEVRIAVKVLQEEARPREGNGGR